MNFEQKTFESYSKDFQEILTLTDVRRKLTEMEIFQISQISNPSATDRHLAKGFRFRTIVHTEVQTQNDSQKQIVACENEVVCCRVECVGSLLNMNT